MKIADEYLSEGKCVAVGEYHVVFHLTRDANDGSDNTNADVEVRSLWIALAKKHNVPIRCVLFLTAPEMCEHNDAVRALNKSVSFPEFLPIFHCLPLPSHRPCLA